MISVFVGSIAGYYGFQIFGDMARNCQVKYVSADELKELERLRIAKVTGKNAEESQLFFGNINRALTLSREIAESKTDKKTKIVLTITSIWGADVKSISKEVYEEVIGKMRRETINSNNNDANLRK